MIADGLKDTINGRSLGLILLLAPWCHSLAQTDGSESTDLAMDAPALEEVLVTASRRVESLQEVPMSVSAFSEDD